jgi:predicted SAM-dependent methyltransferase
VKQGSSLYHEFFVRTSTFGRFLEHYLGSGVALAWRRLRFELHILRLHRKSVRKAQRMLSSSPVRLHCGCGPEVKEGWINIDITDDADLQLDLRTKLPFPDNSVSFIYSEHFFEHLEYPSETGTFLKESLRVLIPRGRFRVGVPDTEPVLNAYVTADDTYFQLARQRWHPAYCDTKMHSINYHFRQESEHKYAYDFETLTKVLYQAGFGKIERSHFDPALDSEQRKDGTLYVDAFKEK